MREVEFKDGRVRRLIEETIIPKQEGRAFRLQKGQVLRIIEIEGEQVADVAIYNAMNTKESYHAGQTMYLNCIQGIGELRRVTKLYSKAPFENVLCTIIDDPVGVHEVVMGGHCSRKAYRLRDGIENHISCTEILGNVIREFGLEPDDLCDTFNPFMYSTYDPVFTIHPPKAKKGDYIDLRAEMDLLIAISACPNDIGPTNNYIAKPLKVEIYG